MQNNKTRFFYVLSSDKTWVFDQSERAQGPVYIFKVDKPRGMLVEHENSLRREETKARRPYLQ